MKISFLTFNPIKYNFLKNNNIQNKQNNNNNFELSNIYYSPVSFGCNETIGKKLITLEDIHCPCCGQEILQDKKIDKLMDGVENIQTSKEFVDFLHENKECINPLFNTSVKYISKIIEDNPNIELTHLLNIMRSNNAKYVITLIKNNINYLNTISHNEDFSENDIKLLNQCKNELNELIDNNKKIVKYDSYKGILQNTIDQMDSAEKYKIHSELKDNVIKAILRRNAFYIQQNDEKAALSPAYSVIKNIFQISGPAIRNLNLKSTEDTNKFHKFNDILLCKKCQTDGSFYSQLIPINEESAVHLNNYLHDISIKIINNKLEGYDNYPLVIRRFFKSYKLDAQDFMLSDTAIDVKKKIFEHTKYNNNELPLIDDIPCAECGKDTISHNQKLKLFEEIENAKDMQELAEIIQKNKHLIRPKFEFIANLFLRKLEINPTIKEETMVNYLRTKVTYKLETKFQHILNDFNNNIDTDKHLSENDKKNIKNFINAVNEKYTQIDTENEFYFGQYNNLIDKTLGQLECENKAFYIYRAKNPIKNFYISHQTLYPLPKTIEKFDSLMKIIVQNIFKYSVQTKDHLIARQRGGTDERKNMLILCKDCNYEKSGNSFIRWSEHSTNLEQNIQKQFDFIKSKIKSGELDKDSLKYINEVGENIFTLSNGNINLDYSI